MNRRETIPAISLQGFLEKRVERFLTPLESFIHKQTTAAILLAFATLVALALANSPWREMARAVPEMQAGLVIHNWRFSMPLKEWMSSGLMTLFFFLIGLELKRETLAGKLRNPRQITLIIMAALGGMVFPALIYWCLNHGTAGAHGWAIPMATDTAFAMGVLALLARRVSYGASIFLMAMAIFDDIGAIAVISLFYAQAIRWDAVLVSGILMGLLFTVNIAGIRHGWFYAILGVLLWFFMHHSGVHATLAGLLMAIAVPARTRLGETGFIEEIRALVRLFEEGKGAQGGILGTQKQHDLASNIGDTVRDASTPLQRWESFLVGPIGIIVLPLFALFNAGVPLSGAEIAKAASSPVTQGIVAGLVIGKPLGVSLFSFLAHSLKLGVLPEGMKFSEVIGVGMLGGIGFTMSLFITMLGFHDAPELIGMAKTGILASSILSAFIAAWWFLRLGGTVREK